MKTAVFTIASRNYFGVVKALMDSLEKTNANYDRFVGVADEIDSEFAGLNWNFNLLSLDNIDIPEKKKMLFRYTILELNTAIKPFVFKTFFEKLGYDRVIYMDPDIYVYDEMKDVDALLDEGAEIILTPHFTGLWPEDDKLPNEVSIMQAGVYNLGFLALAKGQNSMKMLDWWGKKLERQCIVSVETGIFVDQKWMDLVPGLFNNVSILRNEGYNVAYWNLSHRTASKKGEKYYFNDTPLIFFHYSGLNPKQNDTISKHQNRFTFHNIGVAKELFDHYSAVILSNGYEKYHKYEYAFNRFENGNMISDLYRSLYNSCPWLEKECGENPFVSEVVFYKNREKLVPIMLESVWNKRPDVQKAYPNINSQDYINWFVSACEREYKLPASYINDYINSISEKQYEKVVQSLAEPSRFFKFVLFSKKHLPQGLYNLCKKVYWILKKKRENDLIYENEYKDGIEVIGYIRSEHGVGEAMRHLVKTVDRTGFPWSIYDFEVGNLSRQQDHTWDYKIVESFDYKILILNINADQIPVVKAHLPENVWNECYKIGVWFWELPEFPDEWISSFEMLDEVWAPTHFIESALLPKAKCPVYYMPLEMTLDLPDNPDRGVLGLPENTFLFLNMYDTLSIASRKNPEAAITAFKKAFEPDDLSVGLVIKINNSSYAQEKDMLEQLQGAYKNIYFITQTLSRKEVNNLIMSCDVAVSLHRSEGLGLLCQEAMYIGKPVIATGWSGNTDFMNSDNSCLVNYNLVEIGQDIGPYKAAQKWAEADVQQATEYMRKLKSDKSFYTRIAGNAKRYIAEYYSTEYCAEKFQERLSMIRKETGVM